MTDSQTGFSDPDTRLAILALAALLLIRVCVNLISPMNLYGDEAQYWRWGQTLDWGYYSKPPMIAWVIHVTTAVFGNAEWAVRLPAPFLHTIGAAFLFLLGRDMYGPRIGLLGALGYALMPAVILSSQIISTDGVLMPFWCAGLYALWRLRDGQGGWVSAIGLGVAIGAGFLSKYAMLYFAIGIALAILIDRDTRRALVSWHGAAALLVACTLFAPHMAWNAAHEFKTVSHTVDNANLGGDLINPGNAVTFLVDQLGVFGPISLLALLFGIFVMRSEDKGIMGRDRLLLCFILPVLIIILGQAVLSRANANWAATAYPAASVLVAAWLTRARANRTLWYAIAGVTLLAIQFIPDMGLATRLIAGLVIAGGILGFGHLVAHKPSGLLWASLSLHAALGLAFVMIALMPAATTTALGFDNALKRTRGWDTAAQDIFAKAEELGATAVLVDEREAWHELDYYADDRTLPLISFRRYPGPKSFSEAEDLAGPKAARVLVASYHPGMRPLIRSDFESFEPVGSITTPLGRRSNGCPITRTFQLYIASGYQRQPRTAEWEEKYDGQKEFPEPPCDPGSLKAN